MPKKKTLGVVIDSELNAVPDEKTKASAAADMQKDEPANDEAVAILKSGRKVNER